MLCPQYGRGSKGLLAAESLLTLGRQLLPAKGLTPSPRLCTHCAAHRSSPAHGRAVQVAGAALGDCCGSEVVMPPTAACA